MSSHRRPDEAQVTVVVATHNRWADLENSLPHHTCPTIVVDNGSTDGTARFVRQAFPHIEVIELGKNLGAQARNVGAMESATPYVAFADDDSWWAPGALERAAAILTACPRLAVLAARLLIGPDERPDPVCAHMERSPLPPELDLPGNSVLGFLACAAVIRRDAFLSVGGFDKVVFFCGEEERVALDLAAAGWGLAYVSDVVAHHYPSPARDPSGRHVLAARNAFLTTLLRRPWPVVAAALLQLIDGDTVGRRALAAALPRMPLAIKHRRMLPPAVEAARQLLDAPLPATQSQ